MPPHVAFPLLAGLLYAIAALLVKRAADLGVGVWRTAFVANVLGAVLFQPLLGMGGRWHLELWWQPVLLGVLFMLGQWFTFTALDRGDVSVATPVLGVKIILVALLVAVFVGTPLRWQLWVGAVLATGSVALLNRRPSHAAHTGVGRTIVTASLAAGSYAIFDVLVQQWVPAWGAGRFLPAAMAVSGVLSFAFIPRFRAPLRAIPRGAWPWLLGGTFLMAAQSVVFVLTVARWGEAAAANVLYSSRGLWSVVLVWVFGHWVRSREQHLGREVLVTRLIGAVLMMSAIVLVLL